MATPVQVDVNGVSIQYPTTGVTGWGDEATQFAIQVGGAFSKLGLDTGTVVDIPGTLDVLGNTDLNGSLDVALSAIFASTVTIVDDLAVDTDTLFVDVSTDRVGINTASPSVSLDVVGDAAISGTLIAGTFAPTDLTVDTNLIKTDSTQNFVGINKTTPTEALDVVGKVLVSSDITTGGLLIADDSTSTSAPPITFTGDTNTGIGRSGADTLDFITNAVPRARISSTGLQSSVIPDLSGSNTTLFSEYKCRAWVNFNGTTASPSTIRGSGNVSSVTKSGTGQYTVNIDVDMPDANYAVVVSTGLASSGSAGSQNEDTYVNTYAAGSFLITTSNAGTLTDMVFVAAAVFR